MTVERIADRIINKLPPEFLEEFVQTFTEAYETQDAVSLNLSNRLGGIAGYKIAWNNAAQMAELAPNAPAVASVLGDHVEKSGVCFSAGHFKQLVIEPEIIAVIGKDFTLDKQTSETAAANITRFHVGFELMDRRNAPGTVLNHPPTIVANNVFNNGLVLGGGVDADTVDYAKIETVVNVDGKEVLRKVNAAPQNPALAVATVANSLAERGKQLKAGDLVLCGTHLPPFEVKSGHIEATMGLLGKAEFTYG